MATKFRFRNIKPFRRKLDKFTKNLEHNKTLLEQIGTTVVALIRTRTLSGRDAKGRAFKPYSPEYTRQRQRKGRTGTVNLSFSGRMLSALMSRITGRNKIRIQFSRSEEGKKALYAQEHGREIMGLTKEEEDKITKIIQRWINRQIKKF